MKINIEKWFPKRAKDALSFLPTKRVSLNLNLHHMTTIQNLNLHPIVEAKAMRFVQYLQRHDHWVELTKKQLTAEYGSKYRKFLDPLIKTGIVQVDHSYSSYLQIGKKYRATDLT